MSSITIHAGDFITGNGHGFSCGTLILKTEDHSVFGEKIPASELSELEIATEESVKKIGGTVGWGVVGAAVFGPAGLLAGLLMGGRKKEVTFAGKFKDGRKMLATTDNKTFVKLKAACF